MPFYEDIAIQIDSVNVNIGDIEDLVRTANVGINSVNNALIATNGLLTSSNSIAIGISTNVVGISSNTADTSANTAGISYNTAVIINLLDGAAGTETTTITPVTDDDVASSNIYYKEGSQGQTKTVLETVNAAGTETYWLTTFQYANATYPTTATSIVKEQTYNS